MNTSVAITLNRIEFYIISFLPVIILIGVIVWLFWAIKRNNIFINTLIQTQNKLLDSFKTDIVQYNEKLMGQFLKASVMSNENHSHIYCYDDLYNLFKKIKDISNTDLHDSMLTTKAVRIAIYLFHNGSKTPNGFSFLKLSCIGERIQPGSGIKEQILFHSNIMVNIYDTIYDELFNNGRALIINNGEEEPDDTIFISSMTKTKYTQVVCIYDNNNNVVGFILAEFNHVYNKNIADDEYDKIKELCDKMTPVLSFTDYANLTLALNKDGENS